MKSEISPTEVKEWGLEELAALIVGTRFRYFEERDLQSAIEALLIEHSVPYLREFALSRADRIDFLCGRVGIEVKIESSMPTVQRQLWRYAADDQIDSLILVTTLTKHRGIARTMNDKPVFVAYLISSIF